MTVLAASGIASLLPFLLVVACPLMMVFMMRGMHGGHGHGRPESTSREQMSMDELKHARDELNDEIGRRAERPEAAA
jgi:DUF2933 family protein